MREPPPPTGRVGGGLGGWVGGSAWVGGWVGWPVLRQPQNDPPPPPPPSLSKGLVVELVRGVLQKAWGLPVVCECIGPGVPACLGQCCGRVCKAMGMVFVKDETGAGMAFTEPAALTAGWELRLAEPLLSPDCAHPGYLSGIFTGVLKNGLPFTTNWASQIFSAVAWLQVALLSGYTRGEAMQAMHKGLYRANATAPHDINSL